MLLEERRDAAAIRVARYQQSMRRYHSRNIRERTLNPGDLVLRRIQKMQNKNKLSPIWEGPFVVAEVLRPGTFKLAQEDGTPVPHLWNILHLKKFYA